MNSFDLENSPQHLVPPMRCDPTRRKDGILCVGKMGSGGGAWRRGVIAQGGTLWLMLDRSFTEVCHTQRSRSFTNAGLFLVPCLGYVIRESTMPRDFEEIDEEVQAATLGRLRKLVLLGDTNDPTGIIPLVNSSPGHVALAVHEATDCYIPTHVDPQRQTGKNRSVESVHTVSLQRGHSTSRMAGGFANAIGARRLVLNHLGARYDTLYTFYFGTASHS